MNELYTLTLFLSWKCNFSCDHCGFCCGPNREEKLDINTAKRCITEAQSSKTLKMVAYSGGEPFLYFEDMKQLMEFSFERGLSGGVVTNCFWADSYEIAFDRLLQLRNIGLDEIITSIDDYHLKYVSIDNIRNVIKAAFNLGIKVGINILMTEDSEIRANNLSELLEMPKKVLEDTKRIWIKESSPLKVGRAKEFFKMDNIKYYGEKELINNPCEFVINNIVVTPDGLVSACCGFGGASENGPSSISTKDEKLDVNEMCLSEISDYYKKDILLNIISLRGPYVLLLMIQEKNPDIEFRKHYVSNCDICEEFSTNRNLKIALKKMIDEIVEGFEGISH